MHRPSFVGSASIFLRSLFSQPSQQLEDSGQSFTLSTHLFYRLWPRASGWELPVLRLSLLGGLLLLSLGAAPPETAGNPVDWGVMGSYATAAVSVVVAILAHLRATQAQKEQSDIDRAALINEAYQDVLSELRSEVTRAHLALSEERAKQLEHRQYCTQRIRELENELHREQDNLARLKHKPQGLERKPPDNEGEADGST